MTDPAPKKTGDLLPRVVTAVVALPILFGLAFFGPNFGLWGLLLWGATTGCWEYCNMTMRGRLHVLGWFAVIGTAAIITAGYWTGSMLLVFACAAATLLTLFLLAMNETHEDNLANAAPRLNAAIAATAYSAILFGSLVLLVRDTPVWRTGPQQAGWLLYPMVVIWSGDTGAYFAGRFLGRHRLAPLMSPKKTWEGAAGGLLASCLGASIVKLTLLPHIEWWQLALLTVPGAILGQLGDLCESLIKRSVGVKDSGTIIYGHGGMLDRVDALIFAGPWFALVRIALGV